MLSAGRRGQRGISLPELMIGLSIGLIVLTGALSLFASNLRSNTDMLKMTRLNNELRGTMDMVVRDLRRATYWGNAVNGVWYPGIAAVLANPFFTIDTATAGQITYLYDVNGNGTLDGNETFRILRDASSGRVDLSVLDAAGNVVSTTPVSDTDLTNITALTFTPVDRTATTTCLKGGPGPVAPTPPLVHVRQVTVSLTATLRSDATVTRTLTESVRVRNDWIEGSCPP